MPVECKSMVGSQIVPYIYEDYVNCENVAKGIMRLYDTPTEQKNELRSKVRKYATTEFSYKKTIDDWHESALKLIDTWRDNRKNWEIRSF